MREKTQTKSQLNGCPRFNRFKEALFDADDSPSVVFLRAGRGDDMRRGRESIVTLTSNGICAIQRAEESKANNSDSEQEDKIRKTRIELCANNSGDVSDRAPIDWQRLIMLLVVASISLGIWIVILEVVFG